VQRASSSPFFLSSNLLSSQNNALSASLSVIPEQEELALPTIDESERLAVKSLMELSALDWAKYCCGFSSAIKPGLLPLKQPLDILINRLDALNNLQKNAARLMAQHPSLRSRSFLEGKLVSESWWQEVPKALDYLEAPPVNIDKAWLLTENDQQVVSSLVQRLAPQTTAPIDVYQCFSLFLKHLNQNHVFNSLNSEKKIALARRLLMCCFESVAHHPVFKQSKAKIQSQLEQSVESLMAIALIVHDRVRASLKVMGQAGVQAWNALEDLLNRVAMCLPLEQTWPQLLNIAGRLIDGLRDTVLLEFRRCLTQCRQNNFQEFVSFQANVRAHCAPDFTWVQGIVLDLPILKLLDKALSKF
jgi:hypothetical protein